MIYTISEVSNLINLSKVSIYKKLKLKVLQEHISKNHGITYIDEVGFNIIRDSLKLNDEIKTYLNSKELDNSINEDIAADAEDLTLKIDYINFLKAENKRLWNELQDKNLQLNSKDRLFENMQVLLKEKPKQDLLMFDQHFAHLDTKILDIKDKLQEEQEEKSQKKKGFFGKIFNKK